MAFRGDVLGSFRGPQPEESPPFMFSRGSLEGVISNPLNSTEETPRKVASGRRLNSHSDERFLRGRISDVYVLGGVRGGLVHLLDLRRRPLTAFGVTVSRSSRA